MPTWTAPPRTDPPTDQPERQMLEGWLEWHRATLLVKCAGLTPEQLAERACPPSPLSLLGLVRHLTEVERGWFQRGFLGLDRPPLHYSQSDPDGDFERVDPARADADLAGYLAEVDAARAAASGRDLDEHSVRPDRDTGAPVSLRWVHLHLIEEYARHNGHADLLRERIDGVTGE